MKVNMDLLKELSSNPLLDYYTTAFLNSDYITPEMERDGYEKEDIEIDVATAEYYGVTPYLDWSWSEFNANLFNMDLSQILKPAEHYLCFVETALYNGASGFKIADSREEVFSRSYDCTFYLTGASKGGKTLSWNEASHDVPTGSFACAVALCDREYRQVKHWLDYCQFDALNDFVQNHLNIKYV